MAGLIILAGCTPAQIATYVFANRDPGGGAPCAQWAGAFRIAGFRDGYELQHMLTLVHRESRCDPSAISPTHDYGLAQINRAAHFGWLSMDGYITSVYDLLNPQVNADVAHMLYVRSGWSPWALR